MLRGVPCTPQWSELLLQLLLRPEASVLHPAFLCALCHMTLQFLHHGARVRFPYLPSDLSHTTGFGKWHVHATLKAGNEEELKSFLMSVKEESEKAGFKLSIQKTKIMASGSITSWQIQGEKVEAVTDFIFLGSQITMDGDCSHEIKRHLLLGRKAVINIDSILKSRDIT